MMLFESRGITCPTLLVALDKGDSSPATCSNQNLQQHHSQPRHCLLFSSSSITSIITLAIAHYPEQILTRTVRFQLSYQGKYKLLKPHGPVDVGTFKTRTPVQTGQQISIVLTPTLSM